MDKIPAIGLGTWNLRGEEGLSMIRTALELGYHHIDTAFNYENQKIVGEAIRGFERDSIFITSKAMVTQGNLEDICHLSLKELKTDYLDLYLIHWPDRSYEIAPMIQKMETLKKEGKIKHYGVSNFTISHLKDWIDCKASIYCNQVEFHPYLFQKKLWQFCKENKIELSAYRPLGKGALLKESIIVELAQQYQKTPAQILLKWLVQKEIPPIVKASSEEHLKENLEISDFSLKGSDMDTLDSLDRGQRFCNQAWSDFDY